MTMLYFSCMFEALSNSFATLFLTKNYLVFKNGVFLLHYQFQSGFQTENFKIFLPFVLRWDMTLGTLILFYSFTDFQETQNHRYVTDLLISSCVYSFGTNDRQIVDLKIFIAIWPTVESVGETELMIIINDSILIF